MRPAPLLRARAHIALRRDLDAQADLRDIIRLDPQCGIAYRLLGELAARRDENESAAIFFREALRLDPGDREASEWLADRRRTRLDQPRWQTKLPAPAAAAGRFRRARTGGDGQPRSLSSPARAERPGGHARFAKGTHAPDDERPTTRKGEGPTLRLGSADGLRPKYAAARVEHRRLEQRQHHDARHARPARNDSIASLATAGGGIRAVRDFPLPAPEDTGDTAPKQAPIRTLTGRPSRPMTRTALPELPGSATTSSIGDPHARAAARRAGVPALDEGPAVDGDRDARPRDSAADRVGRRRAPVAGRPRALADCFGDHVVGQWRLRHLHERGDRERDADERGREPHAVRTHRDRSTSAHDEAERDAGDEATDVPGVVDVPAGERERQDPQRPSEVVAAQVACGVTVAQREPDRDADQAARSRPMHPRCCRRRRRACATSS